MKQFLTENSRSGRVFLPSLLIAVLAAFLAVSGACNKPDSNENGGLLLSLALTQPQTKPDFVATLRAVTGVTTTAQGSFSANLNATTGELSYTYNWSGLSSDITGVHIHTILGGGVVVGLSSTNTAAASGSNSGTVTLTADQVTALRAGNYYVNVHTANNAAGEISGAITVPL